ncbi:M15 family metallopeptidase, partial [Deinococcus phoenicis]|uniref:M15 family metallopeptidase n=1 Tax=Deinococcus phoenicis TaxID=1476583 RepID=UPI00054D1BDE
PAWRQQNIVTIPLADLPDFPRCPYGVIKGVSLHRLVAPVFQATWAELVHRGLHTQLRTFDGSIAFRHMGHDRTRPLSVHAFGAALDFDAAWNGYGVPLERAQINREVVRVFEECGWTWGGRWTGAYSDAMHFQWTDPLSGVRVPEWQDAAARVSALPAPPPAPPVPALPANWFQVYDPETRQPTPGLWVSLQRNQATGEVRPFRVPAYKLKERGLG